jgi:RNA polymerase sigma-70 factor, ECF subfamily
MAATGAEEMRGIPAQRRRGEPEKHLVAAVRNNDEAAIRSIIRAHNRMLFRIARSILSSDDDAEDAVQAAYMRAFTSLSGFRGEARIGTWLGRIVLNERSGACAAHGRP